jgi:hypothetical protein
MINKKRCEFTWICWSPCLRHPYERLWEYLITYTSIDSDTAAITHQAAFLIKN